MTLIEGEVTLLSVGRAVAEHETRWRTAGLGWEAGRWKVLVGEHDMVGLRREASTWVKGEVYVIDGHLGDVLGVSICLDLTLDPGHVRLRYEKDL